MRGAWAMTNQETIDAKIARLALAPDKYGAVTTQLIQTGTQDAVATAFANQYEGQWVHAHGGGVVPVERDTLGVRHQ